MLGGEIPCYIGLFLDRAHVGLACGLFDGLVAMVEVTSKEGYSVCLLHSGADMSIEIKFAVDVHHKIFRRINHFKSFAMDGVGSLNWFDFEADADGLAFG